MVQATLDAIEAVCGLCERPAGGSVAVCAVCQAVLAGRSADTRQAELDEVRGRLEAILIRAGSRSACRGCGTEVFWLGQAAGRRAAYERGGRLHLSTCPRLRPQ